MHTAAFGPISCRITISASSPPILRSFSQQLNRQLAPIRSYMPRPVMGKKKSKSEYNDFLDGEKLRDNAEVRTSLQTFPAQDNSSVPAVEQARGSKQYGKSGAAKKPPLTHFLCLPLVTETTRSQLQDSLENFKQDLANETSVPLKAVRPVGTLHLTLGVMSLPNPQALQTATQYLDSLDLHSILRDTTHRRIAERAAEQGEIGENLTPASMPSTDAITLNLEALVPMQAPQKTSILYAEPRDASQRLQSFAEAVRKGFMEERLLVQDSRALRLHATVVNTVYAKGKGRGRARSKTAKLKDGLKAVEKRISPHHKSDEGDGAEAAVGEADGGDQNQTSGDGHGPDANNWMRFDASSLIEKYKDFIWARDVRVDRVCICEMGAKKIWSGPREGESEVLDERYKVVAEKEIF